VLSRSARGEADPPRQPLGAGAEAVAPAAARVEFPDEVEEPRGGGIQVRRELGDLVAESLQLQLALRRGMKTTPTLHLDFSDALVTARRLIPYR
jgi:hypothetical protein